MRILVLVIAALVLSSCGENGKPQQQQYPMTCARQTAMFEAGYKYYWSGDRLAVYSDNGDHYLLTEEETAQGYMFDMCYSGYDDDYGRGYGYGYGEHRGNKKKNWKKHRRHPKDRILIREKNNSDRDGDPRDTNWRR